LHSLDDVLRKNVEIGYWLSEEHWGKGLMKTAVKETVEWAFQNLDITRVYARVYGNNSSSTALLEKCGFVKEAHIKDSIYKNREFLDELIYAIRK